MGNERTLFSFGCSEEFCEMLREWLFQTDFLVEGYTNYKRVWASHLTMMLSKMRLRITVK